MSAPAYTRAAQDVAADQSVDPHQGLTTQEATASLEQSGHNELLGAARSRPGSCS